MLRVLPTLLVLLTFAQSVSSIGCYVCTSINGSDPGCEDVFVGTTDRYVNTCLTSWTYAGNRSRTRHAQFPGKWCIKFTAYDPDTKIGVTVRGCALENGGINTETEIGMSTHCGWMNQVVYNGKQQEGCITTCGDDGCNSSSHFRTSYLLLAVAILVKLLPI